MGGNRGTSWFTLISGFFLLSFILLMAPNTGVRLIVLSSVSLALAAVYAFPSVRKRISTNINLMMTMLIGGLWHGASWNFVLWGGLNGLGLIVYKGWRKISPWGSYTRWWHKAVGVMITFHFISMTRIWFRSGSHVTWSSLDAPHDIWTEWFTANAMIEQLLFGFWSSPFSAIASGYAPILGLMTAGMAIHCLPERIKINYRMAFANAPQWAQLGITFATILLAYSGMSSGVQPFIYFQF